MKSRILMPVAAAAIALSSFASFAQDAMTTQGVVTAVDPDTHELTLDDGSVYTLPDSFDASTVAVGDAVSVEWEADGDQNAAVSVTPVGE